MQGSRGGERGDYAALAPARPAQPSPGASPEAPRAAAAPRARFSTDPGLDSAGQGRAGHPPAPPPARKSGGGRRPPMAATHRRPSIPAARLSAPPPPPPPARLLSAAALSECGCSGEGSPRPLGRGWLVPDAFIPAPGWAPFHPPRDMQRRGETSKQTSPRAIPQCFEAELI